MPNSAWYQRVQVLNGTKHSLSLLKNFLGQAVNKFRMVRTVVLKFAAIRPRRLAVVNDQKSKSPKNDSPEGNKYEN
jgi:hypothetical protein